MLALIFDTETTELIKNHSIPLKRQPEVIEFYGAMVDLAAGDDDPKHWFHSLVQPTMPITTETTKITGITHNDVVEAPSFVSIAPTLKKFIESAPVVIAHNLSFDMEMIDIEYERLGLALSWPKTRICTVESTVHLRGYRLSLMALHEYLFGHPFSEAHRAAPDTKALIRCAIELYKLGEI